MIDPARRGAAITAPPGSRDGEDNARIADMFDAVRHENRRDPAISRVPRARIGPSITVTPDKIRFH
jgi:hypothetical protein